MDSKISSNKKQGESLRDTCVPGQGKVGLTDSVSAAEAKAVLEMTEDRTYPRGACIFNLGDQQKGLHFVKKGLVEEYRLTEGGKKLSITRIGPGNMFAISVVNGNYCCFAETVDESVVGFLSFERLGEICRKNPGAAVNLIRVLASHAGELEDRLERLAFSSLRARVGWALLQLSATQGYRLAGVTHETLADLVASSRPKISVVLEELKKIGLVRLARGEIYISKPEDLEKWTKQMYPAP